MTETVNVTFRPSCMKCGHNGIVIPENPSPDSIITCPACHAELGTHGEFQAKVQKAALDALGETFAQTIKDTLGNSPHFKLDF